VRFVQQAGKLSRKGEEHDEDDGHKPHAARGSETP
jgi:hypothetical protein